MSSLNGIGVGIPYATYEGTGSITDSSTFYAPLETSLILQRGTGDPTWSRATKAWGFNELGYLEELASGCAFFGGARLVRNRVVNSESFLSGWTKNNGTETINSANNVTFASSSDGLIVTGMGAGAMPLNAQVIMSARLWTDSGTYSVRFRIGGTYSSVIPITTTPMDYSAVVTCGASSTYGIFASGSGGTINATNLQIVDVTNYDASYVPEYVSIGVVATPFFGAGIDGAKYFNTGWNGAPLTLQKFRREASAINNLLHSRDLSNAAWSTKTNITATKTATGLDGIANTATTLTFTAADAIILQPISLASAARCASAYVKRRTGTGTISFTQDGTNWTDITAQINSSTWSRVEITSTLANPSVGFKGGTLGDEIYVDCVQNEAGAVATSPIVTTTATVSRNADSLTFQTAGNIDFAVGTAFVGLSCQSSSYDGFPLACTSSGRIIYCVGSTQVRTYDGTTTVSQNSATHLNGGKSKIASSWSNVSSLLRLTANGSAISSGAFDGTMGSGATINVGGENSAVSSAYIGPVAGFNYQMTDAELQAITT